jgi:AcrR family transcriptional regulator
VAIDDPPTKTDGRRAAGAETRRRLIEAAADLLAADGEHGVTLRAVGKAADANIAAVRYHFGSREGLIAEVVGEAARHVIEKQLTALSRLADDPRAPVAAEWVEAWATPLIQVAVGRTDSERRLGRIVGKTLAAPFDGLDVQLRELSSVPTERLIDALDHAAPRTSPSGPPTRRSPADGQTFPNPRTHKNKDSDLWISSCRTRRRS